MIYRQNRNLHERLCRLLSSSLKTFADIEESWHLKLCTCWCEKPLLERAILSRRCFDRPQEKQREDIAIGETQSHNSLEWREQQTTLLQSLTSATSINLARHENGRIRLENWVGTGHICWWVIFVGPLLQFDPSFKKVAYAWCIQWLSWAILCESHLA